MLETDVSGGLLKDDNLLLLINVYHEDIDFTLPEFEEQHNWDVLLDSLDVIAALQTIRCNAGQAYPVGWRALVLLKQVQPL